MSEPRAHHSEAPREKRDDGARDLQRPELVAFRWKGPPKEAHLAPAPRWREWMNETEYRWANRCLPLLMANESGWVIGNPVAFTATWGGEPNPASMRIEFAHDLPSPGPVEGFFGYGILTWIVPFLFRTPPGYNLLARGPANWPKDGVQALEGLVETDWSVASFTMNWKITRPNHPVTFEEGEPFCMVVPQRRGELESFNPVIRDIESDPETAAATRRWTQARHQSRVEKFLAEYSSDFAEARTAWEGDYFRGRQPDGTTAPEHETRRALSDFTDELS